MKKIFKTITFITLATIPLLSLAENTDQSFNDSKAQAKSQALLATPNQENIKMFKDLISYGENKLQSRLENILKDKEKYPQVATEISNFKTNIKSEIQKFKSTNINLPKIKQINIKNILSKGIFKTLDQKIAKLESADTKIAQKISLLIASNVDASSTANLLANAEQKLTVAKSAVAEIKSQINSAVSSRAGISSEAIKASVNDANAKILEAVDAYKNTLDSIPQLADSNIASSSPSQIENSTSTDATTTETTIDSQNSNEQTETNQNQENQSNTDTTTSSSDPQTQVN